MVADDKDDDGKSLFWKRISASAVTEKLVVDLLETNYRQGQEIKELKAKLAVFDRYRRWKWFVGTSLGFVGVLARTILQYVGKSDDPK